MVATITSPFLLPGQAAAPPGPLDLTVTYAFHHGFRRDLTVFARAAALTPVEDSRAWWALRRRWTLLADLFEEYQKREREGLRPLLLQRTRSAGDVVASSLILATGPSAPGVEFLMRRCWGCWAGVTADADARARNQLHESMHLLREHVDGHLAHVERHLCSMVQVYVPSTEWARLAHGSLDPLPPRSLLGLVLPWLFAGLDREATSRLEAAVGRTQSLVWRATRSAFSAAERRTFSYALDTER